MGRADKGLVLTTGNFNNWMHEESQFRDGATAIDLIDGVIVGRIIKNNTLGV